MAKNDRRTPTASPEAVISIIGMGMTLTGDCETDGALRVEGTITGNVRAGKAVVIGKNGLVDGNIYTQDAVIAGRVLGCVHAESRLELQSTSQIAGEITARRMQLEEGATLHGQLTVGEDAELRRPEDMSAPDFEATGDVADGVAGTEVGAEELSGRPAPGDVIHGGEPTAGA